MFKMKSIWQQRFRDPAILNLEEIHVLEKIAECPEGYTTPSDTSSGHIFMQLEGGFRDEGAILEQLIVDGWVAKEEEVYKLASDAPEFKVTTS